MKRNITLKNLTHLKTLPADFTPQLSIIMSHQEISNYIHLFFYRVHHGTL